MWAVRVVWVTCCLTGCCPPTGPLASCVATEAAREAVLAPNGHALLGPLVFKPTTEGTFSHHFVVMNNYTGLEVVTVAGRAIEQPLLLRDVAGTMKTVGVTALTEE